MEFTEFLDHMDEVARGREMLVYITDELRAFVPMPEPPPEIDPVLEQEWANALLHDLERAGLAWRWMERPGQVIVFNDAGEVIPA